MSFQQQNTFFQKHDKRYQLKPSLILCVVIAAIVIMILLSARYVNMTIADKLEGYVLYESEGVIYRYDGGTKETEALTESLFYESCKDAVFMEDENHIAMLGTAEGGTYLVLLECTNDTVTVSAAEKIAQDGQETVPANCLKYVPENGQLVFCVQEGAKSRIMTAAPDSLKEPDFLYETEETVTGLTGAENEAAVYFSTVSENNTAKLYSCVMDGKKVTELATVKDAEAGLTQLDEYEGKVIGTAVGSEGRMQIWSLPVSAEEKTEALSFNSGEYNCRNGVMISSSKFLVSSDAEDGNYDIYVCNGSNKQALTGTRTTKNEFVTDYLPAGEK